MYISKVGFWNEVGIGNIFKEGHQLVEWDTFGMD